MTARLTPVWDDSKPSTSGAKSHAPSARPARTATAAAPRTATTRHRQGCGQQRSPPRQDTNRRPKPSASSRSLMEVSFLRVDLSSAIEFPSEQALPFVGRHDRDRRRCGAAISARCCRRPRRWRPPRAAQPGTHPRRRTPGRSCPRPGPLRSARSPACHSSVQYHHWSLSRGDHGRKRMPGALVISTSQLVTQPSAPQRHHTTNLPTQSMPGPRTLPSTVRGSGVGEGNTRTLNKGSCSRATPIDLRAPDGAGRAHHGDELFQRAVDLLIGQGPRVPRSPDRLRQQGEPLLDQGPFDSWSSPWNSR